MAVAKKAKALPAKSKDAKASSNKKTAAKPAAKPAAKKAPEKVVSKKNSTASPAKPAVKAKTPAPVAKPKSAAPVKKAPEPVKKSSPVSAKPTPAKTEKAKPVAAPSKGKSPEKSAPVKAAPAKQVTAPLSAAKGKSSKPEPLPVKKAATKSAEPPKKEAKTKAVAGKKQTSSEDEPEMDPADAKAKKIMKELEETMDLAAMKPRIKVPTPTKTITTRHLHNPPLRLVEPTNTNKVKYSIEFEFRSSPKILFNALSDSSGLAGWFADEVRTKDDQFTFVWEGGESYARLVALKDMHLVRFQWNEDTDGTYFQFEIKQDELTGEIALVITDFALAGEKDTNMRLWESQVQNLRMLLGSL